MAFQTCLQALSVCTLRRTPKFFNRFKCEFEVKTMEEQGVGDLLPSS